MDEVKKLTIYDNSAVFTTNVTTLYSGCLNHHWINAGLTLQGISLKICMKCGETKQAKTSKNCQK